MKKIYYTGYIAYVFLFILSILFYKERIIFSDAAFYIFRMVAKGELVVPHARYIASITEIFPLLAVKLGLPLKTVILSYSIAFTLYFSACYWVTGHVLRQYHLALVLLLFNTIFITHTFYWMLSELTLGIALMIVILAYTCQKEFNNLKTIPLSLVILGICTVAFAHPLIFIPFVYCFFFLAYKKKYIIDGKTMRLTITFFTLSFVMKRLFLTSQYESQAGGSIKEIPDKALHIFNLHSTQQFFNNCLHIYYWIPILFLLIVVWYAVKKEWLHLWVFTAFTVGYLVLVFTSYDTSDTSDVYIENLLIPIGIFLAMPFAFHILPKMQKKNIGWALILLIMFSGGIRIYNASKPYAHRLNWERNYLTANLNTKLVINSKKLPADVLMITWGIPFEVWLLSTIEYNKTVSIAARDNVDEILWATGETRSFIDNWEVTPYNKLPPKYFKFTDSISVYKVIR